MKNTHTHTHKHTHRDSDEYPIVALVRKISYAQVCKNYEDRLLKISHILIVVKFNEYLIAIFYIGH